MKRVVRSANASDPDRTTYKLALADESTIEIAVPSHLADDWMDDLVTLIESRLSARVDPLGEVGFAER